MSHSISGDVCGIMPPRQNFLIGFLDWPENYLPECLAKSGHWGPHVFRLPDGRFIAWEDDLLCGCCTPEEEERCFVYREVSGEEKINCFKVGHEGPIFRILRV